MHDILNELDLSYNGRLELSDYLQVKAVSDSKLDKDGSSNSHIKTVRIAGVY